MSLYLDPDKDKARDGPLFDLPDNLMAHSESMHAAALVVDRMGILLRGDTGSGKSVLQRQLREMARIQGMYSALVSDDYIRLVRPASRGADPSRGAPPLVAFAPLVTRNLQEVRGLGMVELEQDRVANPAVMHLLVDLVEPDALPRMPSKEQAQAMLLGYPLYHLAVPSRSAIAASDLIFARLSTWKHGG